MRDKMSNTITKSELLKVVEELEAKSRTAEKYRRKGISKEDYNEAFQEQGIKSAFLEAAELLEKRFALHKLEKKEHEEQERARARG